MLFFCYMHVLYGACAVTVIIATVVVVVVLVHHVLRVLPLLVAL
jgi:hypothetical protein